MRSFNKKFVTYIVISLALLVSVIYLSNSHNQETEIGGDFTLTNQYGQIVNSTDFDNKYKLIYFGFTHCPGSCPMGLELLTEVLNDLGQDLSKEIAPIFITLDPDRDNPETLKDFIGEFHEDFVALTGSQKEIDDIAKKFKVSHTKGMVDGDNYMINHSSLIYFMDKDGKYITHFNYDEKKETILEEIKKYL